MNKKTASMILAGALALAFTAPVRAENPEYSLAQKVAELEFSEASAWVDALDDMMAVYSRHLPDVNDYWQVLRGMKAWGPEIHQKVVDVQASVYYGHFSAEELRVMADFYQSPAGVSYRRELPSMMIGMMRWLYRNGPSASPFDGVEPKPCRSDGCDEAAAVMIYVLRGTLAQQGASEAEIEKLIRSDDMKRYFDAAVGLGAPDLVERFSRHELVEILRFVENSVMRNYFRHKKTLEQQFASRILHWVKSSGFLEDYYRQCAARGLATLPVKELLAEYLADTN